MPIAASRVIHAPPAAVFSFLAEIENHWPLASSLVSLDAAYGDGGQIVVHGPLGLERHARTRLTRVDEREGVVEGLAEDEDGTLAVVTWRVAGTGGAAKVALAVDIKRRGSIRDRGLLLVGGGLWLRRCLRRTLVNLEDAVQRR